MPFFETQCIFCHPGTLTLRAERQSARMSKITSDSLARSVTGCFTAVTIWQQWRQRVNLVKPWWKNLYLLTLVALCSEQVRAVNHLVWNCLLSDSRASGMSAGSHGSETSTAYSCRQTDHGCCCRRATTEAEVSVSVRQRHDSRLDRQRHVMVSEVQTHHRRAEGKL